MNADRILNEQRHKSLLDAKLWVGETYIHFESRIHAVLGSIAPEFVVLKAPDDSALPKDFKLIWDKQDFINEFVSEFSMNQTHEMFPEL